MRRHPNNLIRNLLIASLIILAAMHQGATGRLAQISTELLLAIVNGIAAGAAAHPGAAIIAAGLAWIIHEARTHRPRTARFHP